MAVTQANRIRYRAILLSRAFKWLFKAMPSRFQNRALAWFWKAMFLSEDGKPHLIGEQALADLRDFARVGQPIFSPDTHIVARWLGRREAVERIINYLNLDEATVQKLMQLDDGLGD